MREPTLTANAVVPMLASPEPTLQGRFAITGLTGSEVLYALERKLEALQQRQQRAQCVPALLCAGQGAAAGAGEAAELIHAGVPRRLGVLARRQHGQLPHGAADQARAVRQRRGAALERVSQARPLVLTISQQELLATYPWNCVLATRTEWIKMCLGACLRTCWWLL